MDSSEREKKQGKNATIVATPRYYDVATMSGSGLLYTDPDCDGALLDHDEDDATIGSAILTALSNSRFVTSEELHHVVKSRLQEIKDKAAQRGRLCAERYAYKNRTEMNKETKHVHVRLSEGQMTFRPNHTRSQSAYSGLSEDQHVIISGDSSPAEIGAAFRLALSRCTSKYD